MVAFWEGVLAGFGIAIPVGAIAILIVDSSLRQGFRTGFAAGAGAATVDLVYALLAVLAGAALASLIAPYALILKVISALILLIVGGYGIWRARSANPGHEIDQEQEKERGLPSTYARFIGLTLLNPITIVYFAALILARDAGTTMTSSERLLFVLGVGLASLSWQTLLASTGALAKRYLSPRFQLFASVFGNLLVMALGVRIAIQIIIG
ncbi:MAG: LysE family transporter [Candidatus Promineifilaceae bacterium]